LQRLDEKVSWNLRRLWTKVHQVLRECRGRLFFFISLFFCLPLTPFVPKISRLRDDVVVKWVRDGGSKTAMIFQPYVGQSSPILRDCAEPFVV